MLLTNVKAPGPLVYDYGKFDCTQHVGWGILLHTISYNLSDTLWQAHYPPAKNIKT